MNRGGLVVLGVGGGMLVGVWLDRPLLAPGLVAVALGLVLVVAGGRREAGELVGGADANPAEGLGDRVQGILKLAEDQAADHLAEARNEAARIVAEARADAEEVRRRPS